MAEKNKKERVHKWYDDIDWTPFMWFICFLSLVGLAFFIRTDPKVPGEYKVAADLLILGAGAIAPRIRSTVKK